MKTILIALLLSSSSFAAYECQVGNQKKVLEMKQGKECEIFWGGKVAWKFTSKDKCQKQFTSFLEDLGGAKKSIKCMPVEEAAKKPSAVSASTPVGQKK